VVDIFKLSESVFTDPSAFGFNPNLNFTWTGLPTDFGNGAAAAGTFAPNEIAFWDGEHPTSAGHGVLAAFVDATLKSDHVQFLDGTQSVIHAQDGNNFIFATPIDPINPNLNNDYTIFGGSGDDLIFAGSGNVTVDGGSGNDLIAAGSGNATLMGGNGIDVLETNSTGTNVLAGGHDADAFIVNRGGTNTLIGGSGDDLFILKESASLVKPDGTFNFGQQHIIGGQGHDTLVFIINDQNPTAETALMAEFQRVVSAFNMAANDHHPGSFQIDGLHVTGITGLELQIDSVSKDPQTPYLITHSVQVFGQAPQISPDLSSLLHEADAWNLLAV